MKLPKINKLVLFSIFTFYLLTSFSQNSEKIKSKTTNNNTFIMTFEPNDCVNCVQTAKETIQKVYSRNIPKQHFIIILEDQREVVKKKWMEEKLSFIDKDKCVLLWNSDLYNKIKASNKCFSAMSFIFVFNPAENKYIFVHDTKTLQPAYDLNNYF